MLERVVLTPKGAAQNWPMFRGPQASGVGDAQGAVVEWDVTSGKNVRWKTPLPGVANASPIIWGNRVYVANAADNGISIPRLSDEEGSRAGGALENVGDEDFIYAFRTVIGRDGRPGNSELLTSDDSAGVGSQGLAQAAAQELAMLDVVRQARFKPAQTPMGQAVAVDMVWLIAKTTAIPWPPESLRNGPALSTRAKDKDTAKPAVRVPAAGVPVSGQSMRPRGSATA